MISDIICRNSMFYVMNENGKEISHGFENSLGELMGFTGTMILFRNRMIYTYDSRFREISHRFE